MRNKTIKIGSICGLIALAVMGTRTAFATRLFQSDIGTRIEEWTTKATFLNKAPIHKDILTTIFWIGERAKGHYSKSNNLDSAWDMRWKENFGGLDSPIYRLGFFPAKFRPKQNPFYVALPFNDVSNPGYLEGCPILQYFKETKLSKGPSVCKNRWIEITYDEKVCYGQWQDVGPIYTNDYGYVFLGQEPKAHNKELAGLDISPAVRDYLEIKGKCRTTWRFVEEEDVPEGPWKTIVTRS